MNQLRQAEDRHARKQHRWHEPIGADSQEQNEHNNESRDGEASDAVVRSGAMVRAANHHHRQHQRRDR
jgi:hypothetical protein